MAAAKTAASAAKPVQSQKAPGSPSAGAGAAAAAAKSPADKPKAPAAAAAAGAGAGGGAAAAGTVALAQSTTGGVKIQLSAAAAAPQTAAPPTIDSIAQDHIFSKQELKRLFRRFKKLDTDKSGTLSVPEFLAIPELEHNPLVRRVVATFDTDKSGEVDFQEFISALSVFAQTDGKDQKFKFTFKMYDVDGDSFISNADLFHVLKAMVGNNLNDTQLQQLVDRTILQGDKDKDGKLSYSEFLDMVKDTDLDEKLKIEL